MLHGHATDDGTNEFQLLAAWIYQEGRWFSFSSRVVFFIFGGRLTAVTTKLTYINAHRCDHRPLAVTPAERRQSHHLSHLAFRGDMRTPTRNQNDFLLCFSWFVSSGVHADAGVVDDKLVP